jgi:DinB superfamily
MSTTAVDPAHDHLRYPIGKFTIPEQITPAHLSQWISSIETLPKHLRCTVEGLTDEQLNTSYREGGWTVRQVVHHLADSHMNCYVRFRLALTEDTPPIKTYNEKGWANLSDARTAPIDLSLQLLDALHARWVLLLGSFSPQEWARAFHHPKLGQMKLDTALGSYAWHGQHHLTHIVNLLERMGW